MAIPYQTAKVKSANMFAMAIWDLTAKFNSCQYFLLYGILYTHYTHTQPRDPCPAYPVISYAFNISEDSGNFIATISHTGNTSVNINGSDYDLLHNQVYCLTVEATNAVGSSHSEEILLCKSMYYYLSSMSDRTQNTIMLSNVVKIWAMICGLKSNIS